jgi:hypothetical protein
VQGGFRAAQLLLEVYEFLQQYNAIPRGQGGLGTRVGVTI